MADRQFSIVSADGEVIPLSTDREGDIALLVGVFGIGVPPVAPRFSEGAADGGSFRGKRYGMRVLDLPIHIRGTSRADIEDKVRVLARAVDDEDGLPKLVASYADGTVYELPFVYVSGLEGNGADSTNYGVQYTLSVTCPDPFWTARDAVQFSVSAGGAVVGLLPDLAKLQLMPSTTLGSLTVHNPGEVDALLSWVIRGPGTLVSAKINGVGWTYNSPLVAGDVLTIVRTTTGVTVANQLGANKYGGLGPAPKFFSLPKGDTNVDLVMTGTTPASSVAGFFRPRRKVVY